MEYYERYDQECTEETLSGGAADTESVFALAEEEKRHAPTDVYVVQPGDTYYGIATKLGITAYQLSGLNLYVDPDAIQVGQQLRIPLLQPDADEICATGGRPHEMLETAEPSLACLHETEPRESESASAIPETSAKRAEPPHREDYTMITMPQGWSFYNILVRHGVSYDALQRANPGMDLDALTPGQTVYVPPGGSRGLTEDSAMGTHIVERLETLDSISRKYRVSTANLLKANPNLAPHDFIAGRVILVPNVWR